MLHGLACKTDPSSGRGGTEVFELPVAYVAIRDRAQPSGGIIDLEYRAVGEDDFDAAR